MKSALRIGSWRYSLLTRRLASALLWCAVMLFLTSGIQADQAQYFYDELGRLVGVVDGQNNAAVYNYDEVGNLLSIQRFGTNGGAVGIFLIAPGSSLVDKPVEIRGFGFTNPPSSNQVSFNGTSALVLSGTSSSIIATVPSGATTGLVTVTNSNGSANSPQAFTVLVPPIITGIDPMKAAQGTTARILIKGFNLKTATSIGFTQTGLTATIQSGGADDTLPVNVSVSGSVPVGSYAFSVTTPTGTAQSGTVRITVTPPQPGFSVTKVVTIQMPLNTSVPATGKPIGPSASTTVPTSVQMPLNTAVPQSAAPSGVSSSTTTPITVQTPLSTTVPAAIAPTGQSFDVSPVTTVGMP